MQKSLIHLFFSIVFVAFISAPTVLSFVDDSIDITMFYGVNEEEESEKHETTKDIELIVMQIKNSDNSLIRNKRKSIRTKEDAYLQFYLNLSTPPPEQHIL